MLPSNLVLQFIIGMLSAFPSLAPTALSLKYYPKTLNLYTMADLETKLLWIPFFYGLVSIIVFAVVKLFPVQFQNFWTIGFIIGLIYPTLGTIDNYAKKIYKIKNYTNLYLNAQLLYLPLYGIVFYYMSKYIC